MNDRHGNVAPDQLLIDLVVNDPPRLVVAGEIGMDASDRFGPVIVDLRATSSMDSRGC